MMKIKCERLTQNIYHLIFPSQWQLAKTFLRFQEHFESPKFRGKIFSLNEFKKWYIENSSEGKKTGKFTYYRDWNGFNIPSKILLPFYRGKFNPLSVEEQSLLRLFRNQKRKKFYIIATFKNSGIPLLKHEAAHGLFYTNSKYKKEVTKILNRIDKKVKKQITNYLSRYGGGYHPKVWADEIHAHIIENLNYLKKQRIDINKLLEINKELNKILDGHLKIQ